MLARGLTSAASSVTRRPIAAQISLAQRRFASGGGGYNQPTGHLFGEKPPPAGTKRAKQDWENLWTGGMLGGIAFATVLYFYKPDTNLQTWAMAEAKKRLEESGEVYQYKPSPNSGHPNGA